MWSPGPIEELGCGSLPRAAWVLNREEDPRELWRFFLEIVQKCWEYDAFMDDSAAFLKKIGLVDSATETDAFLEKTCKMKVTLWLKKHGRSMDQT